MKSFEIKIISIILLFFFFSPGKNQTFAAPNKKYLSKGFIDGSIGRAFYVLTEAASVAGVGFRQREAIAEAKKIARNLRELAKGDPNERYVIWKVGELEAQIYLEERDLVLQQMQKGQQDVNQLIVRFNAEVGKSRPDFATLKRIHTLMSRLDVSKANEVASSFNKRYRAISKEVLYSIEKNLANRNLEKAQEELGYCLRNRSYLAISESQYSSIETRVVGLTFAAAEKPFIKAEVDSAFKCISANRISEARNLISSAKIRFSNIKANLSASEASQFSGLIDRVSGRMGTREDSLVRVNLNILRSKGVKDADKYMRTVLKPCGVSRDKVALVDEAILSISSPDNTKMSEEIGQLASHESSQGVAFDDMLNTAKKKAQEKLDSIAAVEQARMRREQIKKARQDSILLEKRLALQRDENRAFQISVEIYDLLDKNKTRAAKSRFNKEKAFLAKFLTKDAYEILEITIENPEQLGSESNIAYIVEKKEEVPPAPQTASSDENLRKNQERAQSEIIQIYEMLEKNNIKEAIDRFQKNRTPLQKYLDKEVFEMLEMTVTQANIQQ
ncbi:MAG: hypothetical protein GX089_16175 [Fibrobacter sp.]|jgi:hypothetical protein|nr:hypothetical protein [Fibrobacter sp.]